MMKQIFLIFISFSVLMLDANAQRKNMSVSYNNDRFSIKINDGSKKINLIVRGDVTLTDDDKGIQTISNDGYIDYRSGSQALYITPGDDGKPDYSINKKRKTGLDASDKTLLESCVELMINNGVDASNRAKRIFSNKGATGVMDEISRFNSDYTKELYLSWLLKNAELSRQEMVNLLNKTNELISSDYYKSELMQEVSTSYLKDDVTRTAYLKTIGNMSSDYYKTQVINKLFNEPSLSDNDFSQVIKIVSGMGSDYYQSEIISGLLKNKGLNKNRYIQAIDAMQGIKSDYYKSGILMQLVEAGNDDVTGWRQLIFYAGTIGSDYYQSEVLTKIAEKMPNNDSLNSELKETARKIQSDYYYGKVQRAINDRESI